VTSRYPAELQVRSVRAAGEDAFSYHLGQKNAAPSLRLPRAIPPEKLPLLAPSDEAERIER
jgi:hypothetical protein